MKGKIKDLLFIVILGSVCTVLLLGIRSYAYPKIERYQEMRLKASILETAGIYSEKGEIDEAFSKNIRKIQKGAFTYYLTPDNNYVFEFIGRGLWGMVEGVIALNPDMETIENIRIISQEETPGLGGRIGEEGFLSQFKKKKAHPRLILCLRTKATAADEVDAITGATMSSQALIKMINDTVKNFRAVMEKG